MAGVAGVIDICRMTADAKTDRQIFNFKHWQTRLEELNRLYASAAPFPHVVIDDFLDEKFLDDVLLEFQNFKADEWINYTHFNEKKRGFSRYADFPLQIKQLISVLSSKEFCAFLSALTGIEELFADDTLEGGGLHETHRSGFLNIHADFSSHPYRPAWKRRVNVLIYLNKNWNELWGGHLELWSKDMMHCEQRIAPHFNRCVIFGTNATSFHGHSEPLNCPSEVSRRSIALYYYTIEENALKVQSTRYHARPQDNKKRWLIRLDNFMLSVYAIARRRLGISDKTAGRILTCFFGNKERNP